jgi:6-phosphogluconate dehydrogenase (decarboxylating)
MVGGDIEAIEIVEPILKDLAIKEGYVHAGGPGCGHFVNLSIMELILVCYSPLGKECDC